MGLGLGLCLIMLMSEPQLVRPDYSNIRWDLNKGNRHLLGENFNFQFAFPFFEKGQSQQVASLEERVKPMERKAGLLQTSTSEATPFLHLL